MKAINIEKLETTYGGGGISDVIGGVCASGGLFAVYARAVSLAIPVVGQVALGGCVVWAIGKGFDWW